MVMNMINYRTTSVPASMGIFMGVPKLMAITSYTVFVDFWKFGPFGLAVPNLKGSKVESSRYHS